MSEIKKITSVAVALVLLAAAGALFGQVAKSPDVQADVSLSLGPSCGRLKSAATDPEAEPSASAHLRGEQSAQSAEKDFLTWKNRMAAAQRKRSTGSSWMLGGGAMMIGALFLLSAPSGSGGGSGDGVVSIMGNLGSNASSGAGAIGMIVGGGVLIMGVAMNLSAAAQLDSLRKEGKVKGYLKAGVIPRYGSVGIQLGVEL